jgi:hypothetical protein
MAKYLDLSAHYEVEVEELLGKKQSQPLPEEKEKDAAPPKETEVKQE